MFTFVCSSRTKYYTLSPIFTFVCSSRTKYYTLSPCSHLCVALRFPEEPVNLRHSFVITSTNISSRLSWEAHRRNRPSQATRWCGGKFCQLPITWWWINQHQSRNPCQRFLNWKINIAIKIISYSDKNTVDLFVRRILFHTNVHYVM